MDQPTPTNWWEGALATITNVWQAFVVPGGAAIWVAYKFRAGRADTGKATEVTREQSFMDRLQARVATADGENVALRAQHVTDITVMRDRYEAELAALRVRLAEVERDRDRGWDLARWWNGMSRDLRHDFANFCTHKQIEWQAPKLPGLEEPE